MPFSVEMLFKINSILTIYFRLLSSSLKTNFYFDELLKNVYLQVSDKK